MADDPTGSYKSKGNRGANQMDMEEPRREVRDLSGKYWRMAKQTLQENMGEMEQQIGDKPLQAKLMPGAGSLLRPLLTR